MTNSHSFLTEELKKRKLPDPLDNPATGQKYDLTDTMLYRRNILKTLSDNIFGEPPVKPQAMRKTMLKSLENDFNGKATHEIQALTCDVEKGTFSFPVHLILPVNVKKAPLFLHITFSKDVPDHYFPVEHIVDAGFGVASFCYNDVVPDNEKGLNEGLANVFHADHRLENGAGAIGYWAWAAQRVLDFISERQTVDMANVAIVGHSRLGKTALWCGAVDKRFSLVVSNESGCGGAAIERGKKGERVAAITKAFPHWFCKKYTSFSGKESEMPFDQHFLLSAIAPRLLYVSSAVKDEWSDPKSEFLSCLAASEIYEIFGTEGLITPDVYPEPGTVLHDGRIGYHLREGEHAFAVEDWDNIMKFWKKHMSDEMITPQ